MKYGKIFLLLISFLFLSAWTTSSVQAMDHALNPGDVVRIIVYDHPEVSLEEVLVQPDGKIAVPLAGELQAAGGTTADLTHELTEKLAVFLESPVVTVNIIRLQQMRVSVLGEVNRPGLYGFERGRTVLEGISMASGWTKDAAKTKVYLYHRLQTDDKAQIINLIDILKNGKLAQNYPLTDGDIIYVSQNKKVDFIRDVLPFVYPAYLIRHWKKEP